MIYTFSFDSQKESQLPTFAWRFISCHSSDDNCSVMGNFKVEGGHALPVGAGPRGDESARDGGAAGEHSCLITVSVRERVQPGSSTWTPQRFRGAERTSSWCHSWVLVVKRIIGVLGHLAVLVANESVDGSSGRAAQRVHPSKLHRVPPIFTCKRQPAQKIEFVYLLDHTLS